MLKEGGGDRLKGGVEVIRERELMKQKSRKMFRETIEEKRSMVEKREVGSGEGTDSL